MRENNSSYADNYSNDEYSSKKDSRHRSHSRDHHSRRKFSSIPSAGMLRAYEDLSEGAADRLIEMAEIEQTHRHEWENRALKVAASSQKLGQICGLLVALAIIGASSHLALNGDYLTASSIAVTGFLSLMVTSLSARKSFKHDRRPRRNIRHNFRRRDNNSNPQD
jgi:uncharacterized membrane protein